jgi:hypothetical protein
MQLDLPALEHRMTRWSFAPLIGAAMLWTGYATGQELSGCEKFAWPLARERAWFAAPDKQSVASGVILARLPIAAIIVSLEPSNQAKFALLPERAAGADKYGGTVAFPALDRAGLYQVTVSDDAWVDVVQDGQYTKSVGSTGRRDCSGVRKSLRFHLVQAPFVVQVSGAAAETITLAVGSPEEP